MKFNLTDIRRKFRLWTASGGAAFFYCLLLAGFYLSPGLKLLSSYFYILIVGFIVTLNRQKIFNLFVSIGFRVVFIYALYYCLSVLWSVGEEASIDYVYYIRHAVYILVFLGLTIGITLKHPNSSIVICHAVFWPAAFSAFVSIIWFYYASSGASLFSVHLDRLQYYGAQGNNPVEGATIYGAAFLLGYMGIAHQRKHDGIYWLALLSLFIILGSVILTQSRGPILALFLSLLVSLAVTRSRKMAALLLSLMLVALACFVGSEAIVLDMIQRGDSKHFEIYYKGVAKIKEALIFGHGAATSPHVVLADGITYPHLHNLYIAAAFWGGITGLVLLLSIIVWAGYQIRYLIIKRQYMLWHILLLYGCLCGLTDQKVAFNHPDTLWMIFWLPLGIMMGQEINRKCKEKRIDKSFAYKEAS